MREQNINGTLFRSLRKIQIISSYTGCRMAQSSFPNGHLGNCGYFSNPQKPCTCAPSVVTKYQKRISGPLLDRIDIHIEAPSVDYEKLNGDRVGETSEAICARVQAARDIQNRRFSGNGSSDILKKYLINSLRVYTIS